MTDRYKPDTVLSKAGRDPERFHGAVNPPVYHASTILFPTVAARAEAEDQPFDHYNYGRIGTPTSEALERAMAELEGGYRAVSVSSGLAAITVSLLALLKAGDLLLMVDTVYGPTRRFCDNVLARFGVETTYYDPLVGAGIADLMRDNTRAVFLESPGSLTFEVQDVPAIAAVARGRGIATLMDNTWATPLFFQPIAHGVDVSIQAATKYVVGHADAMLGVMTCRDAATFRTVKRCAVQLGQCAGPDDIYLGLRGLRTLAPRLRQHQENGLKVARWLQERPEVARVLHPALPDDPGHPLWQRDFTGACGLFGVVLTAGWSEAAVAAMVDGLRLFGIGASWGGFESLILPMRPDRVRTAITWAAPGPSLRLHVGLEDPDDLIADLTAGFDRLNAAA